MLSRISKIWGVENLGWKIWGGKCYLESRIWGGVENGKFGGGGKFGVENAISKFEFGGWKIWGGNCYLESRISNFGGGKCYLEIWGVENWGGVDGEWIWGGKCYLESRILGVGGGKFGVEKMLSNRIFGVENLGWKMLSRISNLGGVENLGWKMQSRNF